jgi:hypothetical protein
MLGFATVTSTRAVKYYGSCFLADPKYLCPRDPEHRRNAGPDYPGGDYVLDLVGKWLVRGPPLHHMRIRQYIRYFTTDIDEEAGDDAPDSADTPSHASIVADPPHGRHFDAWAFGKAAGSNSWFEDFTSLIIGNIAGGDLRILLGEWWQR